MNEKIDQVAQALLRVFLERIESGGDYVVQHTADEVQLDGFFYLNDLARAAIEAMRGPPRELCVIAFDRVRPTLMEEGYADGADQTELLFNAVIDEVLK